MVSAWLFAGLSHHPINVLLAAQQVRRAALDVLAVLIPVVLQCILCAGTGGEQGV